MKRTIISLQKDVDAATSTCEQSDSFNQFITLVSNHGGISRLTIFNDTWHTKNSHAAKLFWGYPSWEETKLYIEAYFKDDVDTSYDPLANLTYNKKGKLVVPELSQFESCLMCRMYFRLFSQQAIVGIIFDSHRTTVGKVLTRWATKWALVGLDLCCLDITIFIPVDSMRSSV